jgi:hypothetical protein
MEGVPAPIVIRNGDVFEPGRMAHVSWLFVGLLACAVLVLVGAEWPRLVRHLGIPSARERRRARKKGHLRLVRSDTDDFAASVERDLAQLPTIDDRD